MLKIFHKDLFEGELSGNLNENYKKWFYSNVLEKADSLLEDLHIWLLEFYPMHIIGVIVIISVILLIITTLVGLTGA